MNCEYGEERKKNSASIELEVYPPQIGKKLIFSSILRKSWLNIGWTVGLAVGLSAGRSVGHLIA